METISNTLFWISNGLLVPVIILLLLFFVRALILIGTFFGEFYQRTRLQQRFNALLEDVNSNNFEEQLSHLPKPSRFALTKCLHDLYTHRTQTAYCERLLANYEVEADKELGKSKTFVKLGPMLGLMGTLIPMGPALVGLANGDISSMAYNMQVAFATTVVGMVIAAIGIITLQVKQRWFAREQNDLEYLYKVLSQNMECDEKKQTIAQ